MTRDEEDLQDEHRLDLFQWPSLYWEKRSQKQPDRLIQKPVPGKPRHQLLRVLRSVFGPNAKKPRCLVILDDAGAGKTVLSLKVQHLLSYVPTSRRIFGDDRRRLVLHWSGKLPDTDSKAWQDKILADPQFRSIIERVHPPGERQSQDFPRNLLEYAAKEGRIVLISDAFDEFDEPSRQWMKATFQNHPKLIWIFTARESIVRHEMAHDAFFQERSFRRLRLGPFTKAMQNSYMRKAGVPDHWRDCFENQGEDEEIGRFLESPANLRMLVRFIEEHQKDPKKKSTKGMGPPLPGFISPSDLYCRLSQAMLGREIRKATKAHADIQNPTWSVAKKIRLCEKALGAVAFRMATQGMWQEVKGSSPEEIEGLIDAIYADAQESFLQGCLKEKIPQPQEAWDWCLKFMKPFRFHNGSTRADMETGVLSFRSRREQEYRIASYLVFHATSDQLSRFTGDPDWDFLWRATIRMPLSHSPSSGDHERYQNAVGLLFQRPVSSSQRRPTVLMWKAEEWARVRLEKGDQSFEGMIEHFHGILQAEFAAIQKDKTKAEILERLFDPSHFVLLADPEHSGLEGDTGHFMMGKKDEQNHVRLGPFLLSRFAMSVEFFSLFDDPFCDKNPIYQLLLEDPQQPKILVSVKDSNNYKRAELGDPQQPAVYVSWWDAWYFTIFLSSRSIPKGNRDWKIRFPEEAEWEYAARAGSEEEYGLGEGGVELNWYNLEKYAVYGQIWEDEEGKTERIQSGRKPNAWGFLHLLGNVWEWVRDPHPDDGSLRVIRGGSWRNGARYCRASCRSEGAPAYRRDNLGFRLAAGPSQGFG